MASELYRTSHPAYSQLGEVDLKISLAYNTLRLWLRSTQNLREPLTNYTSVVRENNQVAFSWPMRAKSLVRSPTTTTIGGGPDTEALVCSNDTSGTNVASGHRHEPSGRPRAEPPSPAKLRPSRHMLRARSSQPFGLQSRPFDRTSLVFG
jgi:hypothetical protein